jgi:hypothetical protein
MLSLLNPVPERLQTLAFRMRPIGQGLLPDGNDFGEIAGIHRHLLRKRDLGSKEAWWMPVGFGSHPGGLAPVGQSAALGQTFAIGQVNRISKMFWTQLADGEAFHPANPEARSGLLDYRLRPKPSLAAFLINTFLLTRLENPREESVPGMLLKDPATTSSVMISALNFDIAVHSLKRSGGLTIAWTTGNEGRLVSKDAALEGLERELNGNGFPPSAWPLPTEHGSVALYPYQSRMGGPVFAISMHGTLVQPVRVTRTGVTKLGPTGLYLFPVGPAPLYIWDTGLDWGEGQPTPE